MTHDEIEELLGAYALDALDADERQEVEDHLATCPRCRAEIAAHREVAALLGNPAGDVPAVAPEDLWDRISASLQDEPPALSPVVRPTRWRRFAAIVPLGAVAAALILVVGLLAAKVGSLDQQGERAQAQTYSVAAVILNPCTPDRAAHLGDRELAGRGGRAAGTARDIVINPSMPVDRHRRRPSSSGPFPGARPSHSACSAPVRVARRSGSSRR